MADFNLDEFKKIVFKHIDPKSARVFIFGSRAIGNNLKFSDIDLGVEPKSELPIMSKIDLEDEFENSDLPFKVDVVDFSKVSKRFQEIAMKKVYYLN